jgi:hypothetical protein
VDVPRGTLREEKVDWPVLAIGGGKRASADRRETVKVDVSRVMVRVDSDKKHIVVGVPIRNVGEGVAMIRDVCVIHPTGDEIRVGVPGGSRVTGIARQVMLPVDELTEVRFEQAYGSASHMGLAEALERRADLRVQVTYTDVGGRQATSSRLDLTHSKEVESSDGYACEGRGVVQFGRVCAYSLGLVLHGRPRKKRHGAYGAKRQ